MTETNDAMTTAAVGIQSDGIEFGVAKPIVITDRYITQNASQAVKDVLDALIELVTNADDEYTRMELRGEKHNGLIEIHVCRTPDDRSISVRDCGSGMSIEDMVKKLGTYGDASASGMNTGIAVRGTNCRGAKDIASLGDVTFDSITPDGKFHSLDIVHARFTPYESREATPDDLDWMGLARGESGTKVTLEPSANHSINAKTGRKSLKKHISQLFALHDILKEGNRKVMLKEDFDAPEQIKCHVIPDTGRKVISERFTVPGYPGVEAKMVVKRARQPISACSGQKKVRQAAILIKSKKCIHEATYFNPQLENDSLTSVFFGHLQCDHIDTLWNEYDKRQAEGKDHPETNPCPIIDPLRQTGLARNHPFAEALLGKAGGMLHRLIEEERTRRENQQTEVANDQTKKNLAKLSMAATEFMQEALEEIDSFLDVDGDGGGTGGVLKTKGYAISPPYTNIIMGEGRKFTLFIRKDKFPEFNVGDDVEIRCATDDISSPLSVKLEEDSANSENLKCEWRVNGNKPCTITSVHAKIGVIDAESSLRVFETEADMYAHIKTLGFTKNIYVVVSERPKQITLCAPLALIPKKTLVDISCDDPSIRICRSCNMVPKPKWGISECTFTVGTDEEGRGGTLTAVVGSHTAEAEITSISPPGATITVELTEDETHLGDERAMWSGNTLNIFVKHPAIKRYISKTASGWMGQDKPEFKLLIAEILTESIAKRLIQERERIGEIDAEDMDWQGYYSTYAEYTAKFLPIAHELQLPGYQI